MISSCVERKMPGTAHTILDELSFKASIRQERQRTERSGQAMVMLLISAEDSGHVTSRTAYDAITAALFNSQVGYRYSRLV
ncbi:MAG: hypothetical protein QM706_09000 [Nitrospira sp.]